MASNEKLSKLLVELERPFESKLFDAQLLPFTDILDFPKAEAFTIPRLPRRRGQPQIEETLEKKSSTPSSYSIFDFTRCYGHREAYDMPREVTERFEASAVSKLANSSLKTPALKTEYERVKNTIKEGIHPVNIGYKSTFVSANKVLIKCPKGRYLVEVVDTKADILGVSLRTNRKFMKRFEKLMNEIYDVDLKY